MGSSIEFEIVDVFPADVRSGNQLAVVHLTDRSRLEHGSPAEDLQSVAREFGFSETVFIPADIEPGVPVPVRIFTPGIELPFAGHPSLGAAWVIRSMLPEPSPESITLLEAVGTIETWFESPGAESIVWMRQHQPEFGPLLDPATVAEALAIDPGEIDAALPVQVVSTGVPYAIVPLASMAAVARAREIADRSAEPFEAAGAEATAWFVFAKGSTGELPADYHARMFASPFGIVEDPATGSAAGCFTAYLARYAGPQIEGVMEQGYEMGRPSRLHLVGEERDGSFTIEVGGSVSPFARGEIEG